MNWSITFAAIVRLCSSAIRSPNCGGGDNGGDERGNCIAAVGIGVDDDDRASGNIDFVGGLAVVGLCLPTLFAKVLRSPFNLPMRCLHDLARSFAPPSFGLANANMVIAVCGFFSAVES